jgi:hypothetical protein
LCLPAALSAFVASARVSPDDAGVGAVIRNTHGVWDRVEHPSRKRAQGAQLPYDPVPAVAADDLLGCLGRFPVRVTLGAGSGRAQKARRRRRGVEGPKSGEHGTATPFDRRRRPLDSLASTMRRVLLAILRTLLSSARATKAGRDAQEPSARYGLTAPTRKHPHAKRSPVPCRTIASKAESRAKAGTLFLGERQRSTRRHPRGTNEVARHGPPAPTCA